MYYKEKIINGVLHYQHSPNGSWYPFSAVQLSERATRLKNKVESQNIQLGSVKNKVAELRKEIKRLSEDLADARIKQETTGVLLIAPAELPLVTERFIVFVD